MEAIVISILSLIGTAIGTFGGIIMSNKLVNYRLQELEKKVDKHNNVVERTFKLEGQQKVIEEKVDNIKEEIERLLKK